MFAKENHDILVDLQTLTPYRSMKTTIRHHEPKTASQQHPETVRPATSYSQRMKDVVEIDGLLSMPAQVMSPDEWIKWILSR